MKQENFVKGVAILSRYIENGDMDYVNAEHDQFWFCAYEPAASNMDTAEREELKSLGWFEDEESWSCWA